jgi:hypothetical protein
MSTDAGTIVIRWAGDPDDAALRRLGELDGRRSPRGDVLLAEVDGTPRAALGLTDRRVVADPFSPTQDLVELLEVRADRLHRDVVPLNPCLAHSMLPRRMAHTVRRGDVWHH